ESTASLPAVSQATALQRLPLQVAMQETLSLQQRAGLRAFRRNRAAAAALAVIALYLAVAVFAGSVAPRDPLKTTSATLRPPSPEFLFGTDDLGRDVFSGVVHGARASLVIGLTVAVLSGLVGLVIGMVAGYSGGWIDDVLMRLTEAFLTPPRFF